jgi:hypothetical protein
MLPRNTTNVDNRADECVNPVYFPNRCLFEAAATTYIALCAIEPSLVSRVFSYVAVYAAEITFSN